MEVYVSRNGVRTGPFTEDQVKSMLAAGLISLDELLMGERAADRTERSASSTSPPSAPSPVLPTPKPRRNIPELPLAFRLGAGTFLVFGVLVAVLPSPYPDLLAEFVGAAISGLLMAWIIFTFVYTFGIKVGQSMELKGPRGVLLRGLPTLLVAVPAMLLGIALGLGVFLVIWRGEFRSLIGIGIFVAWKWYGLSKRKVQAKEVSPPA